MNGSRKKIYITIIAIGGLALVLDRILAGSKPASAEGALTQSSIAKNAEITAEPANAQLRVEVPPFPEDIPQNPIGNAGRNPFDLTDLARTALYPPSEPDPESAEAIAAVKPFSLRHELSAIIRVGSSRVAIIDDLSVSVGQQIDECIVESMTERQVSLSCPGGPAELTIAGPMGAVRVGEDQ